MPEISRPPANIQIGAPVLPKHGLNLVFTGYKLAVEQLRAIWFKHANVEERARRADVVSPDIAATK